MSSSEQPGPARREASSSDLPCPPKGQRDEWIPMLIEDAEPRESIGETVENCRSSLGSNSRFDRSKVAPSFWLLLAFGVLFAIISHDAGGRHWFSGPTSTASSCERDPYLEPGYLTSSIDRINLEENRWVPFDPTCSTGPSLLADVTGGRADWLRGRTIALLGDSVESNFLKYFCWSLGGKLETIPIDDPRHPPPLDLDDPTIFRSDPANVTRGAPQVCHVPKYDFMIVFVFHLGLIETDYFKTSSPHHYYHPFKLEDRVSSILVPLMKTFRGPEFAGPDLISISSFEWDWKWRSLQFRGSAKVEDPDYKERILGRRKVWEASMPGFSERLTSLMDHVLATFSTRPNSYPILFRIPHTLSDWSGKPVWFSTYFRPATEEVLRRERYRDQVIEMRLLLGVEGAGTESGWMEDGLHPTDLPLNYVWSQYMLFHLKKAVLGRDS